MSIQPGLTHEIRYTVLEKDTASSSGGATLPPVFSTPRMIGMMESTAHRAVLPLLPEGQTTVGTMVNIKHLAATPVGMEVTIRAELLGIDGRRLLFKVEAWDATEKIGEGEHERFIIDSQRFIQRLAKKQSAG